MTADGRSPTSSPGSRPPHPATLSRGCAVQPKPADGARPPHPATVVQAKPLHPATVVQAKPLHPATVVQAKPPDPATMLQREVASPGARAPLGRGGPAIIQRNKEDYFNAFREGYRDGFREGLKDGLEELVGDKVLNLNAAKEVYQLFQDDRSIQVESITKYTGDYVPGAGSKAHRKAGYRIGSGAGFDRGYEVAISDYGYDRQYQPIPNKNKIVAAQDNNGVCVYCNSTNIEDIDHIEPLKVHWGTRGAKMDKQSRSDEANDVLNLVGACAACNRSKGSKRLGQGWWPSAWGNSWWPFGPNRVKSDNSPPPYW